MKSVLLLICLLHWSGVRSSEVSETHHYDNTTEITTIQPETTTDHDLCRNPRSMFAEMADVRCRGVTVSCRSSCGKFQHDYTMGCSCDALCPIYGDCCLDFHSQCPDLSHDTPAGLTMNSGVCIERYDELQQRALMIGQCAREWDDEETEKKCRTETRTIYGLVPVTDNTTAISYSNVYCARCNYVGMGSLIPWKTNITCDDSFQPTTAEELLAGFDQFGCVNQLFPPESVKPTLRACENDRGSNCTTNRCDNEEVRELCEGGFTLRLSYKPDGVIYKNPFCALCHLEEFTDSSYKCPRAKFSDKGGLGSFSFSLLMDFSDSGCAVVQMDGSRNKVLGEDCSEMANMVNESAGICAATDILCQEAFWKSSSYSNWMGLITIICLSASMVCMVSRIIAHPFVKVYHNLPNEMQLCLVVAMFLTAVCFLLGPTQVENRRLCASVGVVMHWMLLASFLWMNAIAYDMFKVFSSIISQSKSQKVKYLTIYSCYAWIISALIVFICLSLDLADTDTTFRPRYGVGVCWIAQRNSLIVFVGGPIAAVIIANTFLFVRTYIYLRSALHSSKLQKCRTGGAQHSFGIYVRLFVLMGLTWVLGYVAAFTKYDFLWALFIILNAGQGVFVSLPSLLSQQVRKYLGVKLGIIDQLSTDHSTSQMSLSRVKKESGVSNGMVMSTEKADPGGDMKNGDCGGNLGHIQESQINSNPEVNYI